MAVSTCGSPTKKRRRRVFYALLGLFGAHTSPSVATTWQQHRVRPTKRDVSYQHVIADRPRDSYQKFWIPSGTSTETRGSRSLEQHPSNVEIESHDMEGGAWWNMGVLGNQRDRVAPASSRFQRLLHDFVGQGSITVGNGTNVTTEVSNATPNETAIYTQTTEDAFTVYKPLRIRAILAESTGNGRQLSSEQRDYLFHELLSPALKSWSGSLRVDPVVGKLTVDASQLVDGETCGPGRESGLPSVRVPLNHIQEGIPETDMIVYLNLGFAGENTLDYSSTQVCEGEFLAASSFCSTDQYDRPTAALLHLCVDPDFFHPTQRDRNVLTITHELGHSLGFNSLSMAHFRRADGTPYTQRVNGEIPDTLIECTGPQSERRHAKVALPSEEILQFREVRGGVRVAEVVTPSVLQVVRNQFDCQDLTGAELESGEGLLLSSSEDGYGCIGDHWERRLFSSDLMNPVIDELDYSPRIPTATLAYFADSGWYQIDLSGSRVASGWGRGAGCGFVNDPCISEHGEVPPQNAPFFCNDAATPRTLSSPSEVHGCTPDLTRKAVCSMGQHEELPWEYQYFQETLGSDVGGNDPLMDYCPVFNGFDNGLCANQDTKKYLQVDDMEQFGEINSRCLLGNIEPDHKTALCLPIACVIEDQSFRFRIDRKSAFRIDRTWYICEEAGQRVELEEGAVIECPDPRRICPTFYCPYDCLGTGGRCDYESGKCLCPDGNTQQGEEPSWKECGSNDKGRAVSDGSATPHPDSPLNDYYVPDERSLQGNYYILREPWAIAVMTLFGMMTIGFGVWYRRRRRARSDASTEWFQNPAVERQPPGGTTPTNRNKDKMVATVLVDMRINENDTLRESLAETDDRLTESDASRSPPRDDISEMSTLPSDSVSEVNQSLGDIADVELQTEARAVRRRRIDEC